MTNSPGGDKLKEMGPDQISRLVRHPESEWLEFKTDYVNFEQIGQNMAAISNALPLLSKQQKGYIVWGVDDSNRSLVGTRFAPRSTKKNNEELEN